MKFLMKVMPFILPKKDLVLKKFRKLNIQKSQLDKNLTSTRKISIPKSELICMKIQMSILKLFDLKNYIKPWRTSMENSHRPSFSREAISKIIWIKSILLYRIIRWENWILNKEVEKRNH